MGKRTKAQLTREQVYSGEAEASSGDDIPLKPKKASREKMAQRKIAHFKSRLHTDFGVPKFHAASSNEVSETSNSSSTNDLAEATQLKSLNANFLKAINDSINVNPVANLTSILQKYMDYYKKVESGELEVKNASIPEVHIKPIAVDQTSTFNFGDFGKKGNELKEPESAQPKINHAMDHKNEKVLSDKVEDVKKIDLSGPKFTLNKLPTSADYGFKFGNIPKNSDESDGEESKTKGPTFKITPELSRPDPNAVFKFSPAPKKEDDNDKKEEKVGSSSPSLQPKPAFSFTSAEIKQPAGETKPSESSTTPGFSFAKPDSNKNKEEPKKDEKPAAKPAFTFGSSTSNNGSGFSGFKFGAGPSLSSNTDNDKPSASAFKFSVPSADSSKPSTGFSFGSNSASTNSNPFGGSNSSSFGFSFTPPSADSSHPSPDNDTKKQDEDNVKGNFAVVKLTEKVDVKTGEEDEKAIFTKRTKLSKFNPENKEKPYETVGVGELKVLVNDKTKKSRILIRSDGNGNVLLNVLILKDLTFSLIGSKKNILRIPTVTSDGKMEMYIAQVKTGDDGSALLKKVQDCQN
ncbi:DEBR0S1_31274g1_1 [Brettanomyces bruxellensis]|uniref:DEBR0S1_31274g1_1 n=1 Tax=Dekkera bruxellensis TaxID=5007 RepID=A0A7D9CW53_DEKBR|nr:DEBR0S1_31274g1_1 [Brettanomyces bruxellensis]